MFPKSAETDLNQLKDSISKCRLNGVIWSKDVQEEDVAYGVKKLRVQVGGLALVFAVILWCRARSTVLYQQHGPGSSTSPQAILESPSVNTDEVTNALLNLPHVGSCEFVAFGKVRAFQWCLAERSCART